MRHLTAVLFLAAASACTTLGPMPATTGVSAVPVGRPGAELQAGITPAFFLSDATQAGASDVPATSQLAAVFEPDRYLGTKGLILGARSWGETGDRPFEPMIGVRRWLDERFAIAGIAYGTHARGAENGASYAATRLGGELAFDTTALPITGWLALHAQATVAATYLDATGHYCVGTSGDGIDCGEGTRQVDASASGVYTSATAGLSLHLARRPTGVIHGVRLAVLGAIGAMPRLHDGVQEPSKELYRSFGLSLTVGFGAAQ